MKFHCLPMFLLYLLHLHAKIYEQCELPKHDGYILTKFYKPRCPYSLRVKDIVDEIDTKLERSGSGIILRYVDCTVCSCDEDEIITVPTLAIHKNDVEIARHRGSGTMEEYVEFLVENTDVDMSVFKRTYRNVSGEVTNLKEADFEKGLDGPWVVLFYEKEDQSLDRLVGDIAKGYGKRVSVGKIHSRNAEGLEKKYNIQYYPLILGIYSSIVVPYSKELAIAPISRFVDELIEPTFQQMSMTKFEDVRKHMGAGEAIFIVFYSDLGLANSYFSRLAHEYKFKARIYKTNDRSLFDKASIWPKTETEDDGHATADEDKVILTVYKHRIFHRCPYKLADTDEISAWIFFSHFPHITRITNDNFYAVFHGFKPTVLLIARNEEHVDDLEKISARYHSGRPFTNFIFSTIDVDAFPLFLPSLLPKLKHPAIVIFDPIKQLFYHRKFKIHSRTLEAKTISLLRDYESGKIGLYPPRGSSVLRYILVFAGIIGIAMGAALRLRCGKNK